MSSRQRRSRLPPKIVRQKNCRLLSLPRELRNQIWEYTLSGGDDDDDDDDDDDEKPITLDRHHLPDQLPLVYTCRQICSETRAIFFKNNSFRAIVCDFAASKFKAFHRTLVQLRTEDEDDEYYSVEVCDKCTKVSIPELNSWLQAYHAKPRRMPGLEKIDEPYDETTAVMLARQIFRVVDAMQERPWAEVRKVVGHTYDAIYSVQYNERKREREEDSENE